MNVQDAIRTKRAVRQFQDQPLPDDVIQAILNAGRRAQSSKNTQPWTFVLVTEREQLARLAAAGVWSVVSVGSTLASPMLM